MLRDHHRQVGTGTANPFIELLVRGVDVQVGERTGATLLVHALQGIIVAGQVQLLTISAMNAGHVDGEAGFAVGLDVKRNGDAAIVGFALDGTLNERGATNMIEAIM